MIRMQDESMLYGGQDRTLWHTCFYFSRYVYFALQRRLNFLLTVLTKKFNFSFFFVEDIPCCLIK